MRLDNAEKAICKEYSKRVNGKVRCRECPLVINLRDNACKRNTSEKDWEEVYDRQLGGVHGSSG